MREQAKQRRIKLKQNASKKDIWGLLVLHDKPDPEPDVPDSFWAKGRTAKEKSTKSPKKRKRKTKVVKKRKRKSSKNAPPQKNCTRGGFCTRT